MKINDVLECFNASLDSERIDRDIKAKGHFVATVEVKKSMGPYKQAYINIVYVNINRKMNIPFCTSSWMDRAPSDKVDDFIEKAEKQALIKFISMCSYKDNWNKLIEGAYGIE